MLIYHTSDLHDHRGIAAPLRAMRERDPGLLFDCGDSLRGSQSLYRRREPIIDEIDAAGYDAQGMGNREFHYLYPFVRARARAMRHPLLCSNLLHPRSPLPFSRSIEVAADGAIVHVISLLVLQYPPGSAWERVFGWRFLDPLAVAAAYAERMPADAPLIVLSHLGLRTDRKLAAAVPRITLLLGGHSHDTLHAPEIVGNVPIVHAGPYGRFVSRSRLERRDAGWELREFALLPLRKPPGETG